MNRQPPLLAKVSCLEDAFQLDGKCEHAQELWERFVLTASRIKVIVAWSRDEGLVSSVMSPGCRVQFLITLEVFITFMF